MASISNKALFAPPCKSSSFLVRLLPGHMSMFRFILEAHDNLAGFTVLNRHTALIRVFCSPHQKEELLMVLEDINNTVPLIIEDWPKFQA